MRITSWRKLAMKMFILSFFLDAYSWFPIGTFDVTTFILVGGIFIVVELFLLLLRVNRLRIDKTQGILIVFIIYEVLDCLLHGLENITSPMNGIFLLTIYIFISRKETAEETERNIKLYSTLMNVMAAYGIYQFIARMFNLPLGDIIIEGHMVNGYNWTDPLPQIGTNVYRSNAIFLEPSFFSQHLAINMLIQIVAVIEKRGDAKTWVVLVMNTIAYVLTFSGTGIIVLIVGGLLFLLSERRSKELIRIFGLILLAVTGLIVISSLVAITATGTKLFSLLLLRINEVKDGGSGYLRFLSGFAIVQRIWSKSPFSFLFGGGAGTSTYFNELYHGQMNVSGYYKTAGELGIIGLILYSLFLLESIKKSKKNPLRSVWVIALSMIPLIMCNGGLLQNYVWMFMYLINVFPTASTKQTFALPVPESVCVSDRAKSANSLSVGNRIDTERK